MKILISIDAGMTAHWYERRSLARALVASGHECVLWDITKKSAYDSFDLHNPDLFIGQTYTLTEALISCIEERPALKVILKASDSGKLSKEVSKEFPILTRKNEEKILVDKLRQKTNNPKFLFIHYHPDYLEETHGDWMNEGYRVESLMNAGDIFDYTNGKFQKKYECDIGLVSGYWPYKAQTLNQWFLPICSDFEYKIKVFGRGWGIPQFCGFLPEGEEKDFFTSSKICVNIHEPHSQKYGFDIVERPFKVMLNKSFLISDYVEGLYKLFGDFLVMAKTPEQFDKEINYYIKNPGEKLGYIESCYKKVLKDHTYFDRASKIMNCLGLKKEAQNILNKKEELIIKMEL